MRHLAVRAGGTPSKQPEEFARTSLDRLYVAVPRNIEVQTADGPYSVPLDRLRSTLAEDRPDNDMEQAIHYGR